MLPSAEPEQVEGIEKDINVEIFKLIMSYLRTNSPL